MEKNFESFYQAELLPRLEQLEQSRIAARNKKITLIAVLAVGGIILSVAAGTPFVAAAALIAGGFIYTFAFRSGDESIKEIYKEQIIKKTASHFIEGIAYNPYDGFGEPDFISLELFNQRPDRYSCEDLFSGKKDKTTYSFSEVHAEYKTEHTTTDKDGNTHTETEWHDIFKGIMYCADFNKDFYNTTILKKDCFKLFSGSNRVKMEDVRFESVFDVYSVNDQEARYLLTPAFMERLLEVNNRFGNDMSAVFKNGKIIMAIGYYENNFEPNQWNTLLNPGKIKHELHLLTDLIGLIDVLELNTRIWTKE